MITYPYAKLNLGLFVTGKRPDGYHNIETVFIPLPTLCDILEIVPTPRQSENIRFTHSGLPMECDEGENLCIKAYELMSQRGELPKVVIHLHKQIPIGAGLGGGSADGAFTLSMLNTMASRPLSATDLHSIALNLGSDCPFFLMGIPFFATGRGEMLEPLSLNLKGLYVVVVNPGISISTGYAYSQVKPQTAPFDLRRIVTTPMEQWRNQVSNDFEKIVFLQHPEVERIKNDLYALGAIYAIMSGSGSTVFGLFDSKPDIKGLFSNMFAQVYPI